jgi:hypothetical protein
MLGPESQTRRLSLSSDDPRGIKLGGVVLDDQANSLDWRFHLQTAAPNEQRSLRQIGSAFARRALADFNQPCATNKKRLPLYSDARVS